MIVFLQIVILIISLVVQYFLIVLGTKKVIEDTIKETLKAILNEMRNNNKWDKR